MSILKGIPHDYFDNHRIDQVLDNISQKTELASKIALIDDESGRTTTYQELSDQSSKLGVILQSFIRVVSHNENPDGDIVVAVCVPPSDRLVTCLYAILKAGAAYVPLEAKFPESRIELILDTAKPVLLVAHKCKCLGEKLERVKCTAKILYIEDLWEELERGSSVPYSNGVPENILRTDNFDETAIILFTSGSSGIPKGVRISHRAVLNRLNWNWVEIPFEPDRFPEKCCWKTSITFVDSLPEIFGSTLQGILLVIFSRDKISQPHMFLELLAKHKITKVILVPSFLKSLLTVLKLQEGSSSSESALESLRIVVSSGESLPIAVLEEFFERFPQGKTLYNIYGSTEMGDISFESFQSAQDINKKCVSQDKDRPKQVPLGPHICHNTHIYILDNDGKMVEEDVLGEIYSSGHNLAKGYVGIKDSDKFVPNSVYKSKGYEIMYRTGDYGKCVRNPLDQRTLLFQGRFDSQIKVRGHRIDLLEVETNMRQSTFIKQVVVLSYHPGLEDQAVVAFVLLNDTGSVTPEDVKKDVKTRLLSYQMPVIKVLDNFPYLVNGKIDRQSLLAQYEQGRKQDLQSFDWDGLTSEQKGSTAFRKLVESISDITGVEVATIAKNLDKSFFDLGGTSLNSLSVIARLRESGYSIGIPDFVTAPSVLELTQKIKPLDAQVLGTHIWLDPEIKKNYRSELMTQEHKHEIIHVSFVTRGDLERLLPGATYEEYVIWMETVWDELVAAPYSYVVRRTSDDKIVAAAINYDDTEEPQNTHGGNWDLTTVCEFISTYEEPFRDSIPTGKGELLQNFMTGTSEDVTPAENVVLMQYMEEENIRIGKASGFLGMMTTNTNLLTQEIAKNHPGYKILTEARLNSWVNSEGRKPFEKAPDSQTIQVCYIDLSMFP